MVGFDVPFNTYVHVCGTDIVRDETGTFMVLEDNARTPSGVAYVVENRHMSLRVMSDLMTGLRVRGVDEYGLRLHNAMAEIAPPGVDRSAGGGAVARHLQLRLFRACLPGARDGRAAGGGPRPGGGGRQGVDAHHRRAGAGAHDLSPASSDDFLDPDAFSPDSKLGVRGLIEAWRRGTVAIANAVGTGVADDKAVYAYMPRIISYYLSRRADPAERRDPYLRRT